MPVGYEWMAEFVQGDRVGRVGDIPDHVVVGIAGPHSPVDAEVDCDVMTVVRTRKRHVPDHARRLRVVERHCHDGDLLMHRLTVVAERRRADEVRGP